MRVYGEPSLTRPVTADGIPARLPNLKLGGDVSYTATALAWHSQPVPGGGTLRPFAYSNPSTVNSSGTIAFVSLIEGAERNQGIFVADAGGLQPIAKACGASGGGIDFDTGCGDPTPIGGTFDGFFRGTVFVPVLNDAGDVLFLADIDDGSAHRGLFKYLAASGVIEKVAVVGDPSPIGGTLAELGPGSMNNLGEVVFLARNSATADVNYLRWRDGTVTVLAAVGDPAPGGGTFFLLATERISGYPDGSFIPIGPVPDVNDNGQLSFRADVTGGIGARGLFLSTGSVHQLLVKTGDPTPAGGSYVDFAAPVLNNNGEVAFFADFELSPGNRSHGWFAGSSGSWRKLFTFSDTLEGERVVHMAWSRNPIQPLNDSGDVVVWTVTEAADGSQQERHIVVKPDGTLVTVAAEGDPTPLGGVLGRFDAWPSLNNHGEITLSTDTFGAPDGVLNAHMLLAPLGAPCVDDATTLCQHDQRFEVEIFWRDLGGNHGHGQVVPAGSDSSGLFWFFAPNNWELLVKVVDGCSFNSRFWVFAAATTNVGYTLRITDTLTGNSKSYENPVGNTADAVTDIAAFDTCSAALESAEDLRTSSTVDALSRVTTHSGRELAGLGSGCTPGSSALCLNDSRFRVEVDWEDFQGDTGAGQVVPFGSNYSGLFWFFHPDNWELLVKVLDGCGLNDRYWVFAAATTNVGYTLTVTDTETGAVVQYSNPLGTAAPAITDTAAFATCQ